MKDQTKNVNSWVSPWKSSSVSTSSQGDHRDATKGVVWYLTILPYISLKPWTAPDGANAFSSVLFLYDSPCALNTDLHINPPIAWVHYVRMIDGIVVILRLCCTHDEDHPELRQRRKWRSKTPRHPSQREHHTEVQEWSERMGKRVDDHQAIFICYFRCSPLKIRVRKWPTDKDFNDLKPSVCLSAGAVLFSLKPLHRPRFSNPTAS